MEKLEEILNKFLEPYKNDKRIIGAILGGSYANGNYNDDSDIDISIITSDNNYKKRGNVYLDGKLIEYFINPISELRKYMESDYNDRFRLSTANLIGKGKIIFAKNDDIEKLQTEALSYFYKEFPSPDNAKIKCLKYACWDSYDELKSKIKDNESYYLNYFITLENLINLYYYENKISSVPISKIEKILRNKEYAKKYNLKNEPSDEFKTMVLDCIDNIDLDIISKLYKYVIQDWNITDFVLENDK